MKKIIFCSFYLFLCSIPVSAEVPTEIIDFPTHKTYEARNLYYFGYFSSHLPDIETGDPSVFSYHLFSARIWKKENIELLLRPAFRLQTRGVKYGEASPSEFYYSDTQLSLVQKSLLGTHPQFRTKAVYKLHSFGATQVDETRDSLVTGLDLEFAYRWQVGFELGYYPKIYFHTFYGKADKERLAIKSRIENWLYLSKELSPSLSISQAIGHRQIERAIWEEFGLFETTLTWDINSTNNLSFGITQEHPLSSTDFETYKETESSYFIMTSIKI